jgi:hypothetical protein
VKNNEYPKTTELSTGRLGSLSALALLPNQWLFSSNPAHRISSDVNQWINTSKMSPGLAPTQPFRTSALMLAQYCKYGSQDIRFRAGCPQTKVPNSVPVTIRHMLS